jgi:uncharacterized protein (TIRG00374 family)
MGRPTGGERRAPHAPREPLGDRIEHAIAEYTDAEREIERGEVEAEARRPSLRRNLVWLAITGVSLYLVAPSLIDVLGTWRDLDQIGFYWFGVIAVLQAGAFVCLWVVQRVALHRPPLADVASSQLAGNALGKIAPAGGAVGAALQYRMLTEAGLPRGRTVAGITAVNLLTFAVVLVLPVLALPAFVRGAVSRDLLEVTLIGLGVFAAILGLGIVVLAFDAPLRSIGRAAQRARNRIRRRAEPLRDLPARLTRERDRLLATLGPNWKEAVAATVGRWAFDFGSLLAALAAVGSTPAPVVVLLAFCAAQVLAQIPFTPGGLGFVEAGLTAMLALAGVDAGDAVLATLAYRLFAYWLQLPLGLVGLVIHRRRHPLAA